MRRMRLPVTVALIAGSLSAASLAHADDARYTLANDCWTLQSTSSSVSDGPFFLKPTDLGSYMFYDKDKQFLSAADTSPLPAIGGAGTGLARAADGGPNGDWTVDDAPGGTFKIMLPAKA